MKRSMSPARGLVRTVVLAVVATGLPLAVASPAHADTAPSITAVRVDTPAVTITKAAAALPFTVRLNDDGTITEGSITLTGPTGSTPITQPFDYPQIQGDSSPADGWWHPQVDIGQDATPGQWHVTELKLTDDGSNVTTLDATALAAYPSTTFQVSRTEHTGGDALALSSLSVLQPSYDTTAASRDVDLSVRVTDAVDGVGAVVFTLTDAADSTNTQTAFADLTTGTKFDGVYHATATLPQGAAAHTTTWNVTATGTDAYGTTSPDYAPGVSFTEVAQPDTVAPVLTSVSVTPASGNATLDEIPLEVTVGASDAADPGSTQLSGVAYGQVTLSGPNNESTTAYFGTGELTSGDAGSGTYVTTTSVPARSAAGPWTVTDGYVNDGYGNLTTYGPADTALPTPGPSDNRTVTVTTDPETQAASLTSLQVPFTTLNAGSPTPTAYNAFHGTAHVLAQSGLSDATFTVLGPDGSTSFDLFAFNSGSRTSGTSADGDYAFDLDLGDAYRSAYNTANGVDPSSVLGTYTLTKVTLTTQEQSKQAAPPTEITALTGFPTSFTYVATPDTVAPLVQSAGFAPSHLSTDTADNSVQGAVRLGLLDDAGSGETPVGLADVTVDLISDSGAATSGYQYFGTPGDTYNPQTRQTQVDVAVTFYGAQDAGTWHVADIVVTDMAGNVRTYAAGQGLEALAPGTLVVDPPSDVTGPALGTISFTPSSIDTSAGPASVDVTVTATDPAGIIDGYLALQSPTGSQYASNYLVCNAGTCTGSLEVPQYVDPGPWTVSYLALTDNRGNSSSPDPTGLPTLTVTGLTDTTSPTLAAVTVDPVTSSGAPLDVTAKRGLVEVRAHITDTGSGFDDDSSALYLESGNRLLYGTGWVRVDGDANDGTYTNVVTVPTYVASGQYTVTMNLRDRLSNQTNLPTTGTTPESVWISGNNDTVAPTVTALTVPGPIDSTGGAANADFLVDTTDTGGAGVQSGGVTFQDPTGRSFFSYFSTSDLVSGSTYKASTTIPQYAHSGTWTVTEVDVYDNADNVRTLTGADLSGLGSTTFSVTGLADSAAPAVTSLAFAPHTVSLPGSNGQVSGSLTIVETESGLDDGSVVLTSPDGVQTAGSYGLSLSGGSTYTFVIQLPSNARPGQWTASVSLTDRYGNSRTVATADLPSGSDRTLDVTNTYDGVVSGTVTDSGTSAPVSGASVSVCDSSSYSCGTGTTDGSGHYSVTNLPNGLYTLIVYPSSGRATRVVVGDGSTYLYDVAGHSATADAVISQPVLPPSSVTVPSAHDPAPGTEPTQYWGDPFTVTVKDQCFGSSGTATVTFDDGGSASGALTETSTPGTYTATLPAFAPHHGEATVVLHLTCGSPDIPFSIYIDPSGTIKDTDNNKVSGATVVLLRSDTLLGSFTAVPDGSTIMSPSNRANPSLSDTNGHYGWDVIAGYYKVQVSKSGCHVPGHPETFALTSQTVSIPPAVTDLDLVLDCHNLAPTAVVAAPPTGKLVGDAVGFDGTGSSDPDGSVASYAWSFGDGASGTGPAPSHAYSTAGDFTVSLVVTDGQGLASTAATRTVHIDPQPATNAAPTAVIAALPGDATAGSPVTFSGAGSSDSDGTVASYAWTFGDGATGTGVAPAHTYAASGDYPVGLTVTDDKGLASTPVTATLHVAAAPAGGSQPVTHALAPSRLLDTRSGVGAPKAAVGPNGAVVLQVTGAGGVPSTGVGAVVLNVTVTSPTAVGYVSAYPSDAARPTASNLNYVKGQTVPNLVVVPVSADGKVTLFNGSGGSTHLIADVAGYVDAGSPTSAGSFGALTPARLLDTRSGVGASKAAVGPNGTLSLPVAGRGGVPASGVGAVVLNLTVTAPTAAGYVTAFPSGTARPTASNLNYVKGQTVPNLVVVPLGSDGKVSLFNGSSGSVQLIADVAGYYLEGAPATSGAFGSVTPARLLDTRSGLGAPKAAVGPNGEVVLTVNGAGGVPSSGVSAVVLNVTVTAPSSVGYITAYPSGTSRPTASNLNYVKGQSVPNLVIVPVGSDGKVRLFNGSSGTVQLIADVAGYLTS